MAGGDLRDLLLPGRLNPLPPIFASIATTCLFMAATRKVFELPFDHLAQSMVVAFSHQTVWDLVAIAPDLISAQHSTAPDSATPTLIISLHSQQHLFGISRPNRPSTSTKPPTKTNFKRIQKAIHASVHSFTAHLTEFVHQCALMDVDPLVKLDQITELLSLSSCPTPAIPPPLGQDCRAVITYFHSAIKAQPFYQSQIVGSRLVSAIVPSLVPLTQCAVPPGIAHGLCVSNGITHLYEHQVDGIKHVISGANLVITTNVSSGKSLVYWVPVLTCMIGHGPTSAPRTLYISPTKALANDQLVSFRSLASACPGLDWAMADAFNGDTPMNHRARIRDKAHVILTNPDMLHLTILPNHRQWANVFRVLAFVVLDEIHMYRGAFGSHCAWIFRRLQRIAAFYGNRRLRFITCSATIGNPVQLVQSLLNITPVHIHNDTSFSPNHLSILWNPPLLNPRDQSAGRHPYVSETARLFVYLVSKGARTLAFTKSRAQCELLFKTVRILIKQQNTALQYRVKAYRAGYSPKDRQAVEHGLRSGELMGVVTTNALEIGIDIGGIDAVVHMGFPGKSAMKQQAGRAGRRKCDSLSILVASNNPLDQYLARHPERLFNQEYTHEEIQLNPNHELIVTAHLPSAAYEVPISSKVEPVLSDLDIHQYVNQVLKFNPVTGLHEATSSYPSRRIQIRSIDQDEYVLFDVTDGSKPRILEIMESSRAMYTLYFGAIFICQGQSYLVTQMSDAKKVVQVRKTAAEYYTHQQSIKEVDVLETLASQPLGSAVVTYSRLQVTTRVTGYHKYDTITHRQFELVKMDAEPITRPAFGMIIELPASSFVCEVQDSPCLDSSIYDSGIHAINHMLISVAHYYVLLSDRMKLRTQCWEINSHSAPYRIQVYEEASVSRNVTQRLFEKHIDILGLVYQLLKKCECEDGCSECVYLNSCPLSNECLSKCKAIYLMEIVFLFS